MMGNKRQYIKKNYYFSFGQGHITLDGVPMKDRYVLVRAENENMAIKIFKEKFSSKRMQDENKYSTYYPERYFEPQFFPLGEYARFEQE